ncbi:MAG: transmembrane 220 family protein [Agriterribacter sp.]
MKILNLIFCFLFIVSAALQYNDPDPYLWMPIYLFGAAACGLAFRNKFYPKVYVVATLLFLGYAVYLFVIKDGVWDWMTQHNAENIAETMKAEKPWIEDTREFFGLAILIALLMINYWYAKKR